MILADLGAEVIKIEPLAGDNTRRLKGSGAGMDSPAQATIVTTQHNNQHSEPAAHETISSTMRLSLSPIALHSK